MNSGCTIASQSLKSTFFALFFVLLQTQPIRIGPVQWACPYCSKVFPNAADVKKHIRIHTGEKPFECHICGKSFAQKSNCNTHLKKFHTQTYQY